jgi:hypothetical protein
MLGSTLVRRLLAAIDLVIVLLFVAIGRSVHDHGVRVGGMISTTWPFALGLGAGWILVVASRRDGTGLRDGVVVTLSTVAVGMVLRVLSGQGTAAAFIAVALGFLGAAMIGWRLALAGLARVRAARDPG